MELLGVPGDVLADRSGWAIAGVFVLLMAIGRLIPRSSHEDRVGDYKERIANLEATLAVRDEQIRVRDEQVTKLLPNTDLTVRLLQGLAREAGRHDLAS
ncbi:hypothetical protein [Micromonospora chalcea]|uniref:hypothetical protein n=1 Tax=Micromonospora chalcea TaxID=1874 RepID=UPI0021A83545|nr:hypothetical protein [Micromonospora chalcea]MCT2279312.1 hypothetical protein [Micromonospora chalcea]